jgi:radical SAM protein with 4Fe4S-binding SPASM domain
MHDKLIVKKILDHYIVAHPHGQNWAIINDFGHKILKLLEAGKSLQDITSVLRKKYTVDAQVLAGDVKEFIDTLKKKKILSSAADSAGARETLPVESLFVHLTSQCNLACAHCYYPKNRQQENLSEEKLISFLSGFYESGGKSVTLSGGEVLLKKDVLKRIIMQFQGLAFSILTNGTLLDDSIAQFFKEHNVSVQVSLDGSVARIHDSIRGTGSFQAALQGIRVLVRNNMASKTNVCATIMSQNIQDLCNMLPLVYNLGIRFIRFITLRKEGRACRRWMKLQENLKPEDIIKFQKKVLKTAREKYPDLRISNGISGFVLNPGLFKKSGRWCPVGRTLVVDTGGDVFPCVLFMEKKYRLGNIHDNSFDEIKSSSVLYGLCTALSRRTATIQQCRTCTWRNFCQGGCAGIALEKSQTVWEPDDGCSYRKWAYGQALRGLVKGTQGMHVCGDEECL